MKRRNFIVSTGVVIGAAYISNSCIAADQTGDVKNRRPDPAEFDQNILKAIAFGMCAPNPHNTQAWKFKLINDSEMLFYVDADRVLPSTDPTYRQIHIGCGCFLGALTIGMSSLQFDTEIKYFPEGMYNNSNDVGKKPIAHVQLKKNENALTDTLFKQLAIRKTNRQIYTGPLVTEEEAKNILSLTNPKYSAIKIITEEAEIRKQLDILGEGMVIETLAYDKHDESRKWFRETDKKVIEKKDGLSLAGGGSKGMNKMFAEWYLKGLPADKWHSKKSTETSLKGYKKAVDSSKGVVLLKTSENNYQDWIKAGIDYIRLQLAAHANDFYLHPMSQVLQEYDEMKELFTAFNQLNKIEGNEKIQMALRIGRSSDTFMSYRRNVEDLLL